MSHPAAVFMRQKQTVVYNTSKNSAANHSNAPRYASKPKNSSGQKKLNSNCKKYMLSAESRFRGELTAIKYDATPINEYRSVQTTGKTQGGGVRAG